MSAEDLGHSILPYFDALGIDPANGPDPARLAAGFHERAETLLHLVASARYCYEDFGQIEPKAAKKNLRPIILEPLIAVTKGFRDLSDWNEEAISRVIEETAVSFEINMGKLGQPIRVAVTGGAVSPPIDVTLALVGRGGTLSRREQAITFVTDRDESSPGPA